MMFKAPIPRIETSAKLFLVIFCNKNPANPNAPPPKKAIRYSQMRMDQIFNE